VERPVETYGWMTSLEVKREVFVRREDLLRSDLVSELILLGFGAVIIAFLLLILVVAWAHAPALV
jgi:hypothetical protein